MASLAKCLSQTKRFLAQEDHAAITAAYQQALADGQSEDEAVRTALVPVLQDLITARADILDQIEAALGEGTLRIIDDALEAAKPRPEPAKQAVTAKSPNPFTVGVFTPQNLSPAEQTKRDGWAAAADGLRTGDKVHDPGMEDTYTVRVTERDGKKTIVLYRDDSGELAFQIVQNGEEGKHFHVMSYFELGAHNPSPWELRRALGDSSAAPEPPRAPAEQPPAMEEAEAEPTPETSVPSPAESTPSTTESPREPAAREQVSPVGVPESLVNSLAATYGQPVSDVARKHAVALEKIGTDGKLFYDLKKILPKLTKADLDAVSWIYGQAKSARTKAKQIEAIEAEFVKRGQLETEAAAIGNNAAVITRDLEDNATDRRRAARRNRVREVQGAIPDGVLPEGLQKDGEGGDAGQPSGGDGAGSARDGERPADADAPASGRGRRKLRGDGGEAEADPASGGRDRASGSSDRATDADLKAAKEQADKERQARRRQNYRITELDAIGEGGAKEKVRANIAAIRLLKELQEQPERKPTAEEKAILVKYVGWGAFAQAVFDDNRYSDNAKKWAKERQEITDLLTADEYNAAKASTLNAHYTSKEVIDGMWQGMQHLGFTGGRALEPSAGVGHFIGLTPAKLATVTDWTAVELDKLTGAIAKYLYEGSDVRIDGFEKVQFPDNFFDLAISNVPFGNYTLTDRKYSKLLIHDYFFAKGLDKVRPGGLVAFITSSGTMDKTNDSARRLIADRADLVGAIRLPGGRSGAFAGNAGTDVTTDIIFLRKRLQGEERRPETAEFLKTQEVQTPDGPTSINAYFAARPDMMLGEMRLTGTMYRDASPVLAGTSENLGQRIAEAAKKMPADVFVRRGETLEDITKTTDLAQAGIKEGSFYFKDGKLFQNVTGEAVPQKFAGKALKRLCLLVDVRDVVNQLLGGQAQGKAADGAALRKKLNKAYDAFVKEFGPINKETVTVRVTKNKATGEETPTTTVSRPNLKDFSDDPDSYKVAAIENFDSETGVATKRAIFTADILAPSTRPDVRGSADALAVSLNETGGVDMARIAGMLKVSEDAAAAEIGDRIYRNPNGEKWELAELYLSGDVVTKLEQAREAAKAEPAYQRNVAALEAAQPAPLSRVDIAAPFGTSWVPNDVYNEFLAKVIGLRDAEVKFEPISSMWIWATRTTPYSTPAAQAAFGTDRVSAVELVMAALNNKPVRVFDKDEDGGQVLNTQATEQAAIKAKLIAETFSGDQTSGIPGWVYEDNARAERLEALYNNKFNRLVKTDVDGSHLTFPGMATSITNAQGQIVPFALRPHQKNAVWRFLTLGNTLLDHAVGLGKTFTMVAIAMEAKRLGMAQRPLIQIPNHMLEQFSREFLQAYPNAKILVAEEKYMEAKNRKAFAARIAADKWDAIIITHSAFGRLPMQQQAYIDFINEEKAEILEAWLDAKRQAKEVANESDFDDIGKEGVKSKPSRDPTVKNIERKKKQIEKKLAKLLAQERKDTGVTFEELGVDLLITDESHTFKNLDYTSRHNLKGLGVKGSQRATDLFLKIRHLEKSRPGRSAVFATGTPMSRSMAEVYTIQRYLQLDTLREYGIERFDSWFATFGNVRVRLETKPNGKLEDVTSATFVNVPELQAIYSRIADTRSAEDVGIVRPNVKGGGVKKVDATFTAEEAARNKALIEQIAKLKGPVKKGEPNHLSLYTRMRQLATDARLLDPDAPFNPNGKIGKMLENVARIYREGKKPALAQIIWLDMGVPNTRKKKPKVEQDEDVDDENQIEKIRGKLAGQEETDSDEDAAAEIEELTRGRSDLYPDIIDRLVASGIPRNEIATIYDAKDDLQKAKLFKAVREGKVRILLGSSAKMGVGTNGQRYLIAAHHLDAPYNPADLVQRDGRIIRQGNENKEVEIYRYITATSADVLTWNLLEGKAENDAKFRAGARGVRTMEDIDSPLPEAAELRAAATGDPRILELAQLQKEERTLDAAKRGHERSYLAAQREAANTKGDIARLEKVMTAYQADAPKVQDVRGDKFAMRLDTTTKQGDVTDRKEAGEAIRAEILRAMGRHWTSAPLDIEVGSISGFPVIARARKVDNGAAFQFELRGEATYIQPGYDRLIAAESDPIGLVSQITNIVVGVPGLVKHTEQTLANKREDLVRLEKQSTPTPFLRALRLAEVKARLEQLTKELKPQKEAPVQAKPDEGEVLSSLVSGMGAAMQGPQQGDDGTPFVGLKEKLYKETTRRAQLKAALLREIENGRAEGRDIGAGVGADRQGGEAAEGTSGPQGTVEGGAERAAISQVLADPAARAAAFEAFLADELKRDAVDSRARAQAFTVEAFHGARLGTLETIDPYRSTGAFGFHVSLGQPHGANARVLHPTALLDRLYQWLGAGKLSESPNPSVTPLRVRAEKMLRMPHVTSLNYGHWHQPMAWIAGMKHPDFDGPEALKRFVAGWILKNGQYVTSQPGTVNHRFSRDLSAELDRLGYDGVIYRDTAQGIGKDSAFFWDSSRVRSALDFFHPDAAGAPGLRASDSYVEQDLNDRLATLLEEEGLGDQEATTFAALRPSEILSSLVDDQASSVTLEQDQATGRTMRRQFDALGFYSKLDEVLGGFRPKDKVTAQTLQQRGVKASELEARGLLDLLMPKGATETVTLYRGVQKGRDPKSTKGTEGGALFMSPDEGVARMYAGEDGSVTSESVTFNNLLTTKNWVEAKQQLGLPMSTTMGELIKAASAAGHDGLSFTTTNGREYIRVDPSKAVPVSDLARVAGENRVQMQERTYGVTPERAQIGQEEEALRQALRLITDEYRARGLGINSPEERADPRVLEIDRQFDALKARKNALPAFEPTKWNAYSLDPSNPTYRETVIHLPEFGDDAIRARMKQMREEGVGSGGPHTWADFEAVQNMLGKSGEWDNFRSGHFPEPNIVGHMMTSMTSHQGRPVYTIDQIQSDWGQKLRDGGVRDEAKIAELEKRLSDQTALADAYILGEPSQLVQQVYGGAFPKVTVPNVTRYLQELAADPTKPGDAREKASEYRLEIDKLVSPLQLMDAELRTAKAATPGNPLVNTTDQWTTTTLRRAITQAVEADADYIAVPSGETVLSYNPGDLDGMRGFYNDIVPKNLRKILQGFDKSIAPQRIDTLDTPTKGPAGKGFTLFPLTDKLKQSVEAEGQAMFAIAGRTETGTPVENAVRLYRGEPANAEGGLGVHYTRSFDRAKGFAGLGGKVYAVDVPIERMGELGRSRGGMMNFTLPADLQAQRQEVAGPQSKVAPGNLRPTPQGQQAYQEMFDAVVAVLKPIIGDHASITAAHRLFTKSGAEQYGRFRPDRALIELAMAYGQGRMVQTGWHEAVHLLRRIGAFSDVEWATLVARAEKLDVVQEMKDSGKRARYVAEYTSQALRMGLRTYQIDAYVKERIEQEYVAHLAERFAGPQQARFGATVDALLQRLADLLKAIADVLERHGLTRLEAGARKIEEMATSADAVFNRMRKGEIANRIAPQRETPPVYKVARSDAAHVSALSEMWSALDDRPDYVPKGSNRLMPFKDRWGDSRSNPTDRKKAADRLREISAIPVQTAPWDTLVQARRDMHEILANSFWWQADVTVQDLIDDPYDMVSGYVADLKRKADGEEVQGQGIPERSEDPRLTELTAPAKQIIESWLSSGRPGVENLLWINSTTAPPTPRNRRPDPENIGATQKSGFYSLAARKLEDVPPALFDQGGQAVINWLRKEGVTAAEINHFQIQDKFGDTPTRRSVPVTPFEMAQAIAERSFDFRRRMSWYNPERPGGYGDMGGTRAFNGPRIPGRGKYFERLLGWPKKLRGGDEFLPGKFESYHWDEQLPATFSSWRGSVRDLPDLGNTVIGEEGQSDYFQGANTGSRPRMTKDEYAAWKVDRDAYQEALPQALGLLRVAVLRPDGNGQWKGEEVYRPWRRYLMGAPLAEPNLPDLDAYAVAHPEHAEAVAQFSQFAIENARLLGKDALEKYGDEEPDVTFETPIYDVYVRKMVQDLILLARQVKAESIAISTSATTARIQNNPKAAHFYDTQLKPRLEKELRRVTGDSTIVLEQVELPKAMGAPRNEKPYTVWATRLSPAARAKIKGVDMPMFALDDGDNTRPAPTTRPFDMRDHDGTLTSRVDDQGLGIRRYAISRNDKPVANVVLVEREPGMWAVAGVQVHRDSRGKGITTKLLESVTEDLGGPTLSSGILTSAQYQALQQSDPDQVRFHVAGGPAFDDLYLPADSIRQMREAAEQAGSSPDQARDLADLKRLEGLIPDTAFAVERIKEAMTQVNPPEKKRTLSASAGMQQAAAARRAAEAAKPRPSARSGVDITAPVTIDARLAQVTGLPVGAKLDLQPKYIFDKRVRKTVQSGNHPAYETLDSTRAIMDAILNNAEFSVLYEDDRKQRNRNIYWQDATGQWFLIGIATTPSPDGPYLATTSYAISKAGLATNLAKAIEHLGGADTFKIVEDPHAYPRVLRAAREAWGQAKGKVTGPQFQSFTAKLQARQAALAGGEEQSALVGGSGQPDPLHLPKMGDTTRSDLDSPETGLTDLVKMVNQALDTETRQGRLNPGLKAQMGKLGAKLYGQFSRRTGVIRLAIPNDFPTLVHEGGHKLEVHPELGNHVEGLKQAFSAEIVPLASPGPDALSEGWAEFFRLWMVDTQRASQSAPGAARAFRNMLEAQSPEMLQALEAIQQGYAALVQASPAGALATRVKSTKVETGAISELRQEITEKGTRATIADRLYALITATLDDKHPIKVARDFLLREAERNLTTALKAGEQLFVKALYDPYKLARMAVHSRNHATTVLQHGVRLKGQSRPTGPAMTDILAAAFGGRDKTLWSDEMIERFGTYLVARRLNNEWERYDLGDLEAPPDHLMSRDGYGQAQNDLELAYPQFRQAAAMLDTFTDLTLRWKHENGFLTDEQLEEFTSREGYAPLNRIMDDPSVSAVMARGKNKRALVNRFKGSTRDFVNPIEAVMADVYVTQSRIALNQIIGAIDKLARAAGPNGGVIAERIPAHDMRAMRVNIESQMDGLRGSAQKLVDDAVSAGALMPLEAVQMRDSLDQMFDETAAVTIFKATETNERGENIVYLWEGGKKVPILMGKHTLGEDVFNVVASVGNQFETNPLFDGLVLFTQAFRAGVTKSPAYVVVNWFRDQLQTWMLSRDFVPGLTGLYGTLDVIRNSDVAQRYNYFAGMSGVESHLIGSMSHNNDVTQLRTTGFFAAPTTWAKVLRVMEVTEAGSRVGHMDATYQRLLTEGYSEEEALFEAAYNSHDVMDFSMTGSKMIHVSRLVAFLRSQMQGLYAAQRTMSGERDSMVNIRDAMTPFVRAAEGNPLQVGEKEQLPISLSIYLKMATIGLIGLALKGYYWDDPEHEELANSQMGATHWFVKLGGSWWRLPKPFELAIFSNLFEAAFDRFAKDDPTAMARFMRTVRETVLVSPAMQAFPAVTAVSDTFIDALDAGSGKMQYDRRKDDLPMRLRSMPPELQWDAYTSEFSKMLAATFGSSPYKVDNFIRTVGANIGRDLLKASDLTLPRLNQLLDGAIPGVARSPRADMSTEDYIFVSRFMRRTPRGAESTFQFWQEMSQDSGRFATAAAGYRRLLNDVRSPRDAQRMLMSLDPETRAYAVLEGHYKEAEQDLHPMNRAKQMISTYNGIRREMAEQSLYKGATKTRHRDPESIVLPPSTQRVVNEILEDMAMREARNAQIVLRKPGWANKTEMPVEGLLEELRAAAPEVAAEVEWRSQHGRNKVYTYQSVKSLWPDLRQHLGSSEPGSSLSAFRSRARYR